MSTSILAPALDIYWEILNSCGLDAASLFEEAEIDPALVRDSNARIPYEKIIFLMKNSVALTQDLGMWLRIEDYWHPSQLGALGYAWLASSSMRTALGRLQRYLRTASSAVELKYQEDEKEFTVTFAFKETDSARFGRDGSSVMIFLTLCRANCGKEFAPAKVSLAQPRPAKPDEFYERYRCPVEFDQAETTVTLDAPILDKPLSSSNPEMARLSDQVMIRYLADHDKNDIQNRVITQIIEQLPSGNISDTRIAEALYMNTRTLQRRLKESGTSYTKLLSRVRNDLAMKYIREKNLTLTEISFLLGFSEMSSFSRAFKKWTGKSPSEARGG